MFDRITIHSFDLGQYITRGIASAVPPGVLSAALCELCMIYLRQLFKILFATSWGTLNAFGWDRKYLGAQLGMTLVLQTWGANLSYHPHVHCILAGVVAGGYVLVKGRWR